jgi:hypothetical protein
VLGPRTRCPREVAEAARDGPRATAARVRDPAAAPPAGHPALRAAPPARTAIASMLSTSRARECGDAYRPSGSSSRAGPARRVRSENAPSSPTHAGSPPTPRPARCRARAPRRQARRSLAPTWAVCSPISSPVAAETAAIVCERLWVSAPSTIIDLVHLTPGVSGSRRECYEASAPTAEQQPGNGGVSHGACCRRARETATAQDSSRFGVRGRMRPTSNDAADAGAADEQPGEAERKRNSKGGHSESLDLGWKAQ